MQQLSKHNPWTVEHLQCRCPRAAVQNWNLDSFIAFFVVFNAVPAVTELLTLFFLSKFSFMKY